MTIGQPNDPYEQEADRVADQVMRMPEPKIQPLCPECKDELQRQPIEEEEKEEETLQTKPLAESITPLIQRQTEATEEEKQMEEEETLQTKTASGEPPTVSSSLQNRITALHGRGQPLPQSERNFFESRFGADFSQVRIHTDNQASEAARAVNARAFTLGQDVVFGAGEYQPRSAEGRRLLAHELTHVVQQRGTPKKHPARLSIQKNAGHRVMRSLALDSTVKICHRVLTSRNIKVSQGGLRVVLLLNQLDTTIPNCQNHKFWVTLTKSVDWGFDDEIATCQGETGGTKSFSFGNLSSGTYYLTIHRVFDHPHCCLEGDILVFDEPIRGDSSGCVRDNDPSVMDVVHGALDIAGFIPVLGAIPDGINAGIYALEGDWANAGLSAVAMVPAWGDGVKLGAIAGKSAIKISEKAAIKLGEEGIAKGLKEVKAASKTVHAAEETGKAAKLGEAAAGKLEKEAAEKLEKEAAQKALEKKIAECEGIHASYKALKCSSCKPTDTRAERLAKIACLTALLAGRRKYLQEKCDYVLAGSIARGSAVAERGHEIQAEQIAKMLLKCSTLPTS
ncbi:DUF4157 domain-containing protein [Leptolyngbya sp. DQ-M1]|uniref:eCIS core domain-containing protein n=1 Tax=Leptolyngbya sp. DQ-M1 TaxID=2933920 RepID=UPI0032972765